MYRFNKESLEYEKIPVRQYVIIVLILLGIFSGLGVSIAPRPTTTTLSQEEKLIVVREYNEFSEKLLIKEIKSLNFKYPHIILAQAYQETGQYKSSIFKFQNNLFGMKQAQSRLNLAKGTERGHAYYDSWQDSLMDYALYNATYLSDVKTEGEYLEYLKQNYAKDPSYVPRLLSIIKKNKLKQLF